MIRIIFAIFMTAFLFSSCSKERLADPAVSPEPLHNVMAKPIAAFLITNTGSNDLVIEQEKLIFSNTSANAESYFWDFGNGLTSTEKVPGNIRFSPCGTVVTITLTVKNKAGESASFSQVVNVLCSGRVHTGG